MTAEQYNEKVIKHIGEVRCFKCKGWTKKWREIDNKTICLICSADSNSKIFYFMGGCENETKD